MRPTNGALRNIIIGTLFAAFIGEVTYNLHQLWALRERVAVIEAKLDQLLVEKRHADSR